MKNIIRLLKTKVNLPGRIGSCFTDIRRKPQIPTPKETGNSLLLTRF